MKGQTQTDNTRKSFFSSSDIFTYWIREQVLIKQLWKYDELSLMEQLWKSMSHDRQTSGEMLPVLNVNSATWLARPWRKPEEVFKYSQILSHQLSYKSKYSH